MVKTSKNSQYKYCCTKYASVFASGNICLRKKTQAFADFLAFEEVGAFYFLGVEVLGQEFASQEDDFDCAVGFLFRCGNCGREKAHG